MIKYIFILLMAASAVQAADSSSYFFVFLNPNPSRPSIPKDSMERLQVAHLNNIERLYHEGKLSIAGPFGDTLGGGIFILKAASDAEAKATVLTDPAIAADRYILEVFPLAITCGKVCVASDLFSLATYPFVRLTYQKSLTEQDRQLHEAYFKNLIDSKKLIFYGSLGSNGSVAIFAQAEKLDGTHALIKADPAVRDAGIRPNIRLWWTAPGVFCEEPQ